MSPEQTSSVVKQNPYTFRQVLDELWADPTSFDGSHDIREAIRKTGANLADVQSEIAVLQERLEEIQDDHSTIGETTRRELNGLLLGAYAARAVIQMPSPRSRP